MTLQPPHIACKTQRIRVCFSYSPIKKLNYAKCPSLPSRPVPLTAPPPPTASAGHHHVHLLPWLPAAAAAQRWRPRSGAKNAGRTRRNANDDVTPGGDSWETSTGYVAWRLDGAPGWMKMVGWWVSMVGGFGGGGSEKNKYQIFWRCNW